MDIKSVGNGKVVLLAGGGKVFTDVAARFVNSDRSLEEIISSEYDAKIVENILSSGHLAATEFDYFVFGIEGYSRVTEVQLVRKRMASYLIKSGRRDKKGKRSFDMVLPGCIEGLKSSYELNPRDVIIEYSGGKEVLSRFLEDMCELYYCNLYWNYNSIDLLTMIENWYNDGVNGGYREEDLRYLKPQATEFKAIIGMNAHALLDWFKIRCCLNAQSEIRDLAKKMLAVCKESSPDLFRNAGASCVPLGYCPENKMQNSSCVGKIHTHDKVLEYIKSMRKS